MQINRTFLSPLCEGHLPPLFLFGSLLRVPEKPTRVPPYNMRRRKIEVQKVGQKHQKIAFCSRAAALKNCFSRRRRRLLFKRIYDDVSPKMHPKTYKICEKMKEWKCEYLLNHSTNFSVWFPHFMNVANHWEDIWWSHPSKMSPNKLAHLRKNESMKMGISTKPLYKLFSVVHNYFLWMLRIIERIYDDRIPPKCTQKLIKFAKKWKHENANIY